MFISHAPEGVSFLLGEQHLSLECLLCLRPWRGVRRQSSGTGLGATLYESLRHRPSVSTSKNNTLMPALFPPLEDKSVSEKCFELVDVKAGTPSRH